MKRDLLLYRPIYAGEF